MNKLIRCIHFYFEPKKEYPTFKYKEIKDNPVDEYYKTSYKLYLLPLYPEKYEEKNLQMTDIDWEVSVIELSEFNEIYKKMKKSKRKMVKKLTIGQ